MAAIGAAVTVLMQLLGYHLAIIQYAPGRGIEPLKSYGVLRTCLTKRVRSESGHEGVVLHTMLVADCTTNEAAKAALRLLELEGKQ